MAPINLLACIVFSVLTPVHAFPALTGPSSSRSTCTSPLQRKSWYNLTSEEKLAYLNAEQCLINKPASENSYGAKTRWDQMQFTHIVENNYVHAVGQFLPWHRYFVKIHETLLREECNYTGAQPYWAIADDVASFPDVGIFDSVYGFGGNGSGESRCITDGPFANMTLRMQTDGSISDYCLSRDLNSTYFELGNYSNIETCFAMETYETAWVCYGNNPHQAGHDGVGGFTDTSTMSTSALSPGDPIFQLHHANLDRLWWEWQLANLTYRLTDMGGQNVPTEAFLEVANWTYPEAGLTNYSGDPANVTTLNHVLWYNDIKPNVTVGDVMDIRGDTMCIEYV